MREISPLLLALGVLVLLPISGQNAQTLSLLAPTDSIESDQLKYTADIKVAGFDGIVGLNFAVSWDSTVFKLDSIGGYPEFFNEDNFGVLDSVNKVSFTYLDLESFTPVTLADSTTLFSLYLSAIGTPGDTSSLEFVPSSESSPIEAVDTTGLESGLAMDLELVNGFISIKDIETGTAYISNPGYLNISAPQPNPVLDQAIFSIQLAEAQNVEIRLVDILGRTLHFEKTYLTAGVHKQLITDYGVRQSGTHFLVVYAGKYQAIQKVVFQQP